VALPASRPSGSSTQTTNEISPMDTLIKIKFKMIPNGPCPPPHPSTHPLFGTDRKRGDQIASGDTDTLGPDRSGMEKHQHGAEP